METVSSWLHNESFNFMRKKKELKLHIILKKSEMVGNKVEF